MTWLLNWRILLGAFGAILLALAVFKVSQWRSDALELPKEKAAHTKDIADCKATATASRELSHDYTDSADRIDADYIRLLEASCSGVPASKPSGGHDAAPHTDQLTLSQRRLNDKQAAQLIACQKTIQVIYNLNGKGDLLPVNQ